MKRKDILQEVDKTLLLLDSMQKAKAGPYFYTRLKVRMRAEKQQQRGLVRVFQDRLLLAAIGVALLLLINMYSLIHASSHGGQAVREQGLAEFANEYNFTNSQY